LGQEDDGLARHPRWVIVGGLLGSAALAMLVACGGSGEKAGDGALANSASNKCGDELAYTPKAPKNAFRLRVAGKCAVTYAVQCNGGTNPTPGTIRPDAIALVNCDQGKTVKTVTLSCQAGEDQPCEFTYEVTDI
jgi:hypothetical protein